MTKLRETEKSMIRRLAKKYAENQKPFKFRVVTIEEDFLEEEWPKIKDRVLSGESGWWNT